MSDQDGLQATALQRPTNDEKDAWRTYWKQRGQSWRTESEINTERQKFLSKRRTITPDIEQGIYPFKDIKLGRADVEWLLATHENGRGPVDWQNESQRNRQGLDMRGANLIGVNLSDLPLTRMLGGLSTTTQATPTSESIHTNSEQRNKATIHLEGASLSNAHLEGANLSRARLNRANLRNTHLEYAELSYVHLEKAHLSNAHLEGAILRGTNLEGAILYKAHLAGAELRRAYFNNATNLEGLSLEDHEKDRYASLADISWGNVNLAVVDWTGVKVLGDEYQAHQQKTTKGEVKDDRTRLDEYRTAVRANRQLAVVLQDQGLNEAADDFSYRAQKLQRVVLRRQRKFLKYLFTGFLFLLAGYGYRPLRSIGWYLFFIFGFALAYYGFGHLSLWPPDAIVYSLTSFHGRGFFPGLENKPSLHDPLVMLAAVEAVVGLLIEISFIATFTQRYFGK